MPDSITPSDILLDLARVIFIDVRKEAARLGSGLTIPFSQRRLPSDVEVWWTDFLGQSVVVFCVHGHEVSQGVCIALESHGVEARFLKGGFEAWRQAGLVVQDIGGRP